MNDGRLANIWAKLYTMVSYSDDLEILEPMMMKQSHCLFSYIITYTVHILKVTTDLIFLM